ncbi:MAG: hypothetical protein HYX75_17630, partial [Acidobacteria bacterium]|nr:hypothetical protein [Acidobacteriota bacterium]
MKQSGRRSLGRFGDPGFAAIEETGPGPSDASRAQLFTPFLTTNRNSQSSCCALIRENLFHYAEAPRSSGSTLKPFIYGLGMEVKGYTAATLLTDTGLALDAHAGAYTFKNYDESFLGPILYRNALGNSRNIPAAQVLQAVGIDVAYRHLCDLGLIRVRENPARYGLGMSIGGLYVTLADLVRAYGILA